MGYTPHVLIVGGGATGTAVARDLAIRGLDVTLVERGTLAAGATGRVQGVLDSGARHAATSPELARRCNAERRTLGEIASHCITDTGGLLACPDGDEWVDACEECDIDVERLSGEDLREVEPSLSGDVTTAVRTPDAVLDPFRLTVATARSARDHGAEIRTHTAVTDIVVEDGAVVGADVVHDPPPRGLGEGSGDDEPDDTDETDDSGTEVDGAGPADDETDAEADDPEDGTADGDDGESDDSGDGEEDDSDDGETAASTAPDIPGIPDAVESEKDVPGGGTDRRPEKSEERIEADYVVNAAGPRADHVAAMADFALDCDRTEWPLVVADGGHVETVLTCCGPDGVDWTVSPYDGHCLLGATAGGGGAERPPTVDDVVDETATHVPSLAGARVLRTFHTLRVGTDDPTLVDHGRRDDCWGMTTVLGGRLTTHRAVAERVADQVCGEFGIDRACRTDEIPLPGSDDLPVDDSQETYGLDPSVAERSSDRLGSRAGAVLDTDEPNPVLCPCKGVTRAEVQDAMADPSADPADLDEIRVRTSATMGECQGGRCAHRLAAELYPDREAETVTAALDDLLASRWAGQREVWGEQLSRAARTYQFHAGLLNHGRNPEDSIDLSAFDDGPGDDDAADDRPRGGYPI